MSEMGGIQNGGGKLGKMHGQASARHRPTCEGEADSA